MHALRLHAPGLDGLVVEEIDIPQIGAGEALVEVHAAAITRDELEWPLDRLPAIPSYELSGVVVEVAPDVGGVSVGDSVYAMTAFDRDGVAANYAAVGANLLAPKPSTLDHVTSAATPLAALTAWQGLFDHGKLEAGMRVLVAGATGGVGRFATQLARWRGAHVIGAVSTANLDAARALGAHEAVDRNDLRLADAVEPVDLVFDTVGGEALQRLPELVVSGGRLVSVAEQPPATTAPIDARYFVVEPNRAQLVEIARLVDEGELRPAVDSVYPLSEAPSAFARSLSTGTHGKVVIRVAGEA